jgi:hypothetical protein
VNQDEFAAKVIGDLADAILALINSKPASPTRDELIKVIGEHEVPNREICEPKFGSTSAMFGSDCVAIGIDELKRLDIKPEQAVTVEVISRNAPAQRFARDPKTQTLYFRDGIAPPVRHQPTMDALKKTMDEASWHAFDMRELNWEGVKFIETAAPRDCYLNDECGNAAAPPGYCLTHKTDLCNGSKPLTDWEHVAGGQMRLFAKLSDYGRRAKVWVLAEGPAKNAFRALIVDSAIGPATSERIAKGWNLHDVYISTWREMAVNALQRV